MRKTLLLFSFFGLISVVFGKIGFFNDYSRPFPWNEDISDEEYRRYQEIADYLRKRAEAAEAASLNIRDEAKDEEFPNEPYLDEGSPSFVYSVPSIKSPYMEDSDFAFRPSDPRFYQDFENGGKITKSDNENFNSVKKKGSEELHRSVEGDDSKESKVGEDDGDENYSPYQSAVYQSPVSEVIEAYDRSDMYFTAIVAGCSAAAVLTIVAIGISCYRLQKNAKAAAEVDYPAYGVTGPHKDSSPTSGDRRLAQSAQMYHYQHQKQQIIAMERASNERQGSISDAESDEENEEGDYTVYECPGLAPTGEMEVKNPLFQDEQTPATPVKGATQPPPKPPQDLPK